MYSSAMQGKTERQGQILKFIRDFIDENGYAPSIRETADHFNISLKGAHDHITALEHKGYIKRAYKISRSITVIR